jgi:hypothetical protein
LGLGIEQAFRANEHVAEFGAEVIRATILIRTIMNHIPSVFGFQTLQRLPTTTALGVPRTNSLNGSTTWRERSQNDFLHATIQQSETLPTDRSVDLSVEIDVLLEEVLRVGSSRA